LVIDKAARQAGVQRAYATSKAGKTLNIVTQHSMRHLHAIYVLDCGVHLNDLQQTCSKQFHWLHPSLCMYAVVGAEDLHSDDR
jgi:hypothetical protein